MQRAARILALAGAIGAAAHGAAGQTKGTVCRGTALGSTVCVEAVPRPEPRPVEFDARRGLDAVRAKPDPDLGPPEIVPPRRTNSFGQTRIGPDARGTGGPCRPDALGNLRCR